MSVQVVSSLQQLFKRVKSIFRVCQQAYAILINFRLAHPAVDFLARARSLAAVFRVKNSDEGQRSFSEGQEARKSSRRNMNPCRGNANIHTRNHPSCVSRGTSLAGELR